MEPDHLFDRVGDAPILTASDFPYPVHTVFNAAATKTLDGKYLIMCRAEDFCGLSHLVCAVSENGVDGWQVDDKPTLAPMPHQHPEELWGIEDPRLTFHEELGKYSVAYTSFSVGGPGVSLALTTDFKDFERIGVVMPPHDKDAAMFPDRFNGRWVMLHRPMTDLGGHIWISYSPDLKHWGEHKILVEARKGGWWDARKIGLGPPPIRTSEGWLLIYHGVRVTGSGVLYRLGLALLDLENPEICFRRGSTWVFGPERDYERFGDVNNVVFPCGTIVEDDGDTLLMYYGCADSSMALAKASIKKLLAWLRTHCS